MPTIDVAEATGLALLCVMQPTSPVDCNIALLPVQASGALHRSSCADSTELEETVKYRTVITDIIFGLLSHVTVHVIGGDPSEEVDVLVGMELCHLIDNGRLGPVDLEVLVDIVIHDQAVGKSNAVRFHRVTCDICIVSDIRVVEISHLLLGGVQFRVERATPVDSRWVRHFEGRRRTTRMLGKRRKLSGRQMSSRQVVRMDERGWSRYCAAVVELQVCRACDGAGSLNIEC